jgi:hypothetical protein
MDVERIVKDDHRLIHDYADTRCDVPASRLQDSGSWLQHYRLGCI